MIMLQMRNVIAGYGMAVILQDLTLDVNREECVVLLGRNGMGKTTTARTIFGLTTVIHGSIRFLGEEISRSPVHEIARKGIALVPQGRRVFPSLSVYSNLALAWRKQDGSWSPEAIFNVFPQLEARRSALAGSLSGGEQEMLAMARALLCNPKLLILDEPSEGLAPTVVDTVYKILRDLKRRGTTILLIEQNPELALEIGDRVYVIENGRVVYSADAVTAKENLSTLHGYLSV
jgi:branched-chain amino acid transport system ATP-binding protein